MDSLLSLTSSLTTPILLPACRSAVLSLFSKLNVGRLDIIEPDGNQLTFGDQSLNPSTTDFHNIKDDTTSTTTTSNNSSSPIALLVLKSTNFYLRLAFGKDLGFAESYMSSECSTPDLATVFSLFIANREALSELDTGIIAKVGSKVQSILNRRYANTKVGSLKNIGAHYDIVSNRQRKSLPLSVTRSWSASGPNRAGNVSNNQIILLDWIPDLSRIIALDQKSMLERTWKSGSFGKDISEAVLRKESSPKWLCPTQIKSAAQFNGLHSSC